MSFGFTIPNEIIVTTSQAFISLPGRMLREFAAPLKVFRQRLAVPGNVD
jgi:hypothetical protein